MAYTETLFIYKDTYLLCKLLLRYIPTDVCCTLYCNGREGIYTRNLD